VLFLVKKLSKKDPLEVTYCALVNLYPLFSLRVKKVAGVKYKIPLYLTTSKSFLISVKFLFQAAKDCSEKTLEEKIANEIVEAFFCRGRAIRLKEQLYAEIDDSRPFLRYLRSR